MGICGYTLSPTHLQNSNGNLRVKITVQVKNLGFLVKKLPPTSSKIEAHDLLILCHRENGGTLGWYPIAV